MTAVWISRFSEFFVNREAHPMEMSRKNDSSLSYLETIAGIRMATLEVEPQEQLMTSSPIYVTCA